MAPNRPFGDFLRSRRMRLEPAKVPGTSRQRRRTPGLKREEVAQRADISVEWYVKLEQGRAIAPSEETVEALGRALMLDQVELDHLRSLAAAGGRRPFRRETAPDVLCRMVASLPEPAYLTGQRFDVLAWNDAASALFGDFGLLAPDDRNILHWMLVDPVARTIFGETWAEEAKRIVSLFRASHDLWPGDPAFSALLDRVRASCPAFEDWWSEYRIGAPLSGTKHLHHPTLGAVSYEYASFQANEDPALKLSLYTRCQQNGADRPARPNSDEQAHAG
jgi:transcriptional regulator with XRE-family HTH domain